MQDDDMKKDAEPTDDELEEEDDAVETGEEEDAI